MSDQHKPLTAAEIEELERVHRAAAADMAEFPWREPIFYTHLCSMMFNAIPRLLAMLQPPADASVPVEIFSAVTCNECKRAWVGYRGCLTEPLPCGHMRSQWAVGSAVVDDMVAASCVRNKSMEDVDDDDEE